MSNKKELAKIAVAALLLASSLPAASHADEVESQGVLLAGGCKSFSSCNGGGNGGNGGACGAASNPNPNSNPNEANPYNRPTSRPANPYDSQSGTYRSGPAPSYEAYNTGSVNQGYGAPNHPNHPNNAYITDEYSPNSNPNHPQSQRPVNPSNPANRNR